MEIYFKNSAKKRKKLKGYTGPSASTEGRSSTSTVNVYSSCGALYERTPKLYHGQSSPFFLGDPEQIS